jgi:hypothetical protein
MIVVIVLLAVTADAQQLPVVQVVFRFDRNLKSPACLNLKGSSLGAVEGQLAGIIRNVIGDEYQFVQWRADAVKPQPGEFIPKVTVVLRRNVEAVGVAYYLDYWRDVRIASDQMTYVGSSEPLYAGDEKVRPCKGIDLIQNPRSKATSKQHQAARESFEILKKRIQRRVRDDITGDRVDLDKAFFSNVTLSRTALDADPDQKKLLLMMPWAKLHAGPNSLIQMRIDGKIRAQLKNIGHHDRHKNDDQPVVGGDVKYFDWPPVVVAAQAWTPQIPAALRTARARTDIEVVMESYDLDRDTEKKLAARLKAMRRDLVKVAE